MPESAAELVSIGQSQPGLNSILKSESSDHCVAGKPEWSTVPGTPDRDSAEAETGTAATFVVPYSKDDGAAAQLGDDNASEEGRSLSDVDTHLSLPHLTDSVDSEASTVVSESGASPPPEPSDQVAPGKADDESATAPSSASDSRVPSARRGKMPPRAMAMRQSQKYMRTKRGGRGGFRGAPRPPGGMVMTDPTDPSNPQPYVVNGDNKDKTSRTRADGTTTTLPYDLLALHYLMNYEYQYQEPDTSSGAPTLPSVTTTQAEVHLDKMAEGAQEAAAATTTWFQNIFCCAACRDPGEPPPDCARDCACTGCGGGDCSGGCGDFGSC